MLRTLAVMVLPESRTIGKMPGPSVPITLLPEISVVWVPAPRSFGSSVPTAIPAQPTALLALMKLFCTVEVIVTGPSIWTSIAMQSMLRSPVRRGAVVGDVEVALPAVAADAAREEAIGLVADSAVAAVHRVAGDRDDVGRAPGGPGVPDWSAGVRVAGPDLDADTGAEVDDRVVRDRRPVDAGCAGRQPGCR